MNIAQVISNVFSQAGSVLRKPAAVAVLGLPLGSTLPMVVSDAGVAYAQNTNATIRGQVLDSTVLWFQMPRLSFSTRTPA